MIDQSNCSGHGGFDNGVCFCEIEYSGQTCERPNYSYYLALSTIYYLICIASFIQLILCINSEFKRIKPPSIIRSFKITTQKALYFFICVATIIRGFYFSSPTNPSLHWANGLMNAYYPVVLSGSSLVVCFWAEIFHLYGVNVLRPSFLSKSFSGFVFFNIVSYSLLITELLLFQFSDNHDIDKSMFMRVFNSIYAVLMLLVVIFFLIYGVEVYFKVRGAFIQGESCPANLSQLKQSRFGLISYATMLLVTVVFLFSEVLGEIWKEKVPIIGRNAYLIIFRLCEVGIALWYPCVLWNCVRPERLWILNPRRILKTDASDLSLDDLRSIETGAALLVDGTNNNLMSKNHSNSSRSIDCWICYDDECKDVGPLIQPCLCKGDVSAVHHDCLKRWLMESHSSPENVHCKVCKEPYLIERGVIWLPSGLTINHWLQTGVIAILMAITIAGSYIMVRLFHHAGARIMSVGFAILIEYICLRFLGFNILSAYQRAKFAAVKIISRSIDD
ncbi:uncharacterized protein LOC107364779 [Tetranychus urticae]|uniref:RING-CH-type domain-containing protein n=1 Tax=Tetranychus urticae TaxID=32264 RepID=T1KK53_TETUR|nr:uncharacterized protein LOC107364779 [Tetranychus urticae]